MDFKTYRSRTHFRGKARLNKREKEGENGIGGAARRLSSASR